MVSLMYSLINLLFFDIPLLYHYTNLNSPIMCCLFSGDICLCFGISILFLASFECNLFEALVIASVVDFLALSRSFDYIYCPCF